MIIQDPIALRDWIEGVVFTLILSGAIAFLDYLAIHGY